MATHTVFGTGAFPGISSPPVDDGSPTAVANAFHITSGSGSCIGARVYLPAAAASGGSALGTPITVSAWTSPDLSTTPVATATITSPVTGWNSVTWPAPVAMTAHTPIWVGYKAANTKYLAANPGGPAEVVSSTLSTLRLSAAEGLGWSRAVYRYGTGASEGGGNLLWGVDLTFSDATAAVSLNVGDDRTTSTSTGISLTATASGGSGTKAYAWSITSGPSTSTTQFSSTATATPTFTPSAAGTYVLKCIVTDASGSAEDSLSVVVSAPTSNATVTSVASSTGWTASSGTVLAALSDSNAGTFVTSAENPSSAQLDVTFGPLSPPAAGQPAQVTLQGLRYTGAASSATATVRLYNGSTLRATSSTVMIPSAATDTVFTFPAADIASVNWATVRCVVTVSAAA